MIGGKNIVKNSVFDRGTAGNEKGRPLNREEPEAGGPGIWPEAASGILPAAQTGGRLITINKEEAIQ